MASVGMFAGILLGIAAVMGGLTGFLLALVLGVVGWVAGGRYEGDPDVSRLFIGRRRG